MGKSFFKKENAPDFFKLLAAQCGISRLGIESLISFMRTSDEKAPDEITRLEKEGDWIRRELIKNTEEAFLTPLDRHDMYSLSRALDDLMDKINDLKDLMIVLDTKPCEHMISIAELNRSAIISLCEAVDRWHDKDLKEFWQCLIRTKKSENEVKRMYWKIIIKIGESELPFHKLICIYEMSRDLNNLGNKVNKAADQLGDIRIKMIR